MTTLTGLKDNVISDNLASFEQIDMKAYGQVRKESYIWGALRIAMGWIFLWSFLDKLFGFGFSTSPDKAWVAGGSPTFGFLNFGTSGPLAEFYQAMAGNATADSLYMLGMLVIMPRPLRWRGGRLQALRRGHPVDGTKWCSLETAA